MEDRLQNRNLKSTIIGDKYVSSALIWRYIDVLGRYVDTYETYVWEYDSENKKLGKWLQETYQNSEEEALKVHDYMVRNFTEVDCNLKGE